MLPLVVPYLPDYVDMIFAGPLKMHAILAVDPADPPPPPVRDAFYHAAQRHRGKVMHVVIFKAPADADDEYGAALRDTLAFLEVTNFPSYLISDMTEADDERPGGAQTHLRGDLEDRDEVLAFQKPFAAKALARRDGLDVKYAEILRDPKFQALLGDERMASLISIMGVPKGLADQARLADEL